MLPRPSTTISLQPWAHTPRASTCSTNVPSASRRNRVSPVTRRRPSGSHAVAQPSPDRPGATTSHLPSRSTATTSSAPQWENHRRPSCQRGDSTIPKPSASTFMSDAALMSSGPALHSWVEQRRLGGQGPSVIYECCDPVLESMYVGIDGSIVGPHLVCCERAVARRQWIAG